MQQYLQEWEIHLHKSKGVHHVRATALSMLCPLEGKDPRNDAGRKQKLCATLWHRGHDDFHTNPLLKRQNDTCGQPFAIHSLVLSLRESKGWRIDWLHRSDYGPPPNIPMVAMDFCFANTESDDDVLTILLMKRENISSSWCDVVARQISQRVCCGHGHR